MLATSHVRALAVVAAAWLSGCATLLSSAPELPQRDELQVKGASFVLQYDPVDARVAREVAAALEVAVPRLARWGTFQAPMTVRIHPSHEALEVAVRRMNYPWLRAWARYDTIDIQSPRTWSLLGASQRHIVELLTHELTHCLMYQLSGTDGDWMRKGIPLWFREGMASVTAEQGYRRPSDEDIWRYLSANPRKDPVADADDLYQAEAEIVYGSAHRAFDFLVDRYGDSAVKTLMTEMRGGARFAPAFNKVYGVSENTFASEYIRYVRWEGWRGRKTRTAKPLVPAHAAPDRSGAAGDPPRP